MITPTRRTRSLSWARAAGGHAAAAPPRRVMNSRRLISLPASRAARLQNIDLSRTGQWASGIFTPHRSVGGSALPRMADVLAMRAPPAGRHPDPGPPCLDPPRPSDRRQRRAHRKAASASDRAPLRRPIRWPLRSPRPAARDRRAGRNGRQGRPTPPTLPTDHTPDILGGRTRTNLCPLSVSVRLQGHGLFATTPIELDSSSQAMCLDGPGRQRIPLFQDQLRRGCRRSRSPGPGQSVRGSRDARSLSCLLCCSRCTIASVTGTMTDPHSARCSRGNRYTVPQVTGRNLLAAFRGGLAEGGCVEGRNVTISRLVARPRDPRRGARRLACQHRGAAALGPAPSLGGPGRPRQAARPVRWPAGHPA